jgi:hypothetical protein
MGESSTTSSRTLQPVASLLADCADGEVTSCKGAAAVTSLGGEGERSLTCAVTCDVACDVTWGSSKDARRNKSGALGAGSLRGVLSLGVSLGVLSLRERLLSGPHSFQTNVAPWCFVAKPVVVLL